MHTKSVQTLSHYVFTQTCASVCWYRPHHNMLKALLIVVKGSAWSRDFCCFTAFTVWDFCLDHGHRHVDTTTEYRVTIYYILCLSQKLQQHTCIIHHSHLSSSIVHVVCPSSLQTHTSTEQHRPCKNNSWQHAFFRAWDQLSLSLTGDVVNGGRVGRVAPHEVWSRLKRW